MSVTINGQLEKISSRRDSTLKIEIGTQEMGGDKKAEVGELHSMQNRLIKVYISDDNIISNEIKEALDEADVFGEKTPSQRLRHVLYRLWEHEGSEESFNDFYVDRMEKLINNIKDRL